MYKAQNCCSCVQFRVDKKKNHLGQEFIKHDSRHNDKLLCHLDLPRPCISQPEWHYSLKHNEICATVNAAILYVNFHLLERDTLQFPPLKSMQVVSELIINANIFIFQVVLGWHFGAVILPSSNNINATCQEYT